MTNPKFELLKLEVASLTQAEKEELVLVLLQKDSASEYSAKPVDLNKYAGSVRFMIDPLEYQRQIRSEWDR